MSKKKISRKRVWSITIGLLSGGLSIFLFITMAAFDPHESIYTSGQFLESTSHIFGKMGLIVASFLDYYFGKCAWIITGAFMYEAVVLIRNTRKVIKVLLSCALFTTWVLSVLMYGGSKKSPLGYGGLIGRMLVGFFRHSSAHVIHVWSKVTFIVLITALLSPFLFKLVKFLFSHIRRKIKSRPIPMASIKGTLDQRKKKEKLLLFKRRDDKPPLIQKVYYTEDGRFEAEREVYSHAMGGRPNPSVYHPEENREYDNDLPQNEDEKGQYIFNGINISEKHDEGMGTKDKPYYPSPLVLKRSKPHNRKEHERETAKKANELERTLHEFGIEAKVIGIIRGPVITRYEIQPAPGVKLSRIVSLSDNIALNLSANGVRIEAPIPGRSAVGIEIPNEVREIVTLGDIIDKAHVYGELPLILGKDISGKIVSADLAEMPHLLIAGATGSGKSVCVNSLIMSLLFKKRPENVRFILIDPKMVELKIYNGIPHLLTEVVTDPRYAAKALRWVIYEMENRYRLLDELRVRDIKGYNQRASDKMPYIVLIIDEFSNLMAISQKDVEDAVVRLAAMSRAVGIHLIMATQRPSVDVITGLIKANFPYRIAFQVASKTDSRTILDSMGAEKLLGRGDMLFSPAGSMNIQRIQGAYISEEEVIQVVQALKKQGNPSYVDDMFAQEREGRLADYNDDTMWEEAVEIVISTKRASASFLQRRLKIGYNRAARLIERMEEQGIIGPPRGSKPREIYIDKND